MVIISGGIYAAAPQTGFDSIEILDNQEELENSETKDNSNEVISTAESTETASEDVEVQIGEIENDIYTNKKTIHIQIEIWIVFYSLYSNCHADFNF